MGSDCQPNTCRNPLHDHPFNKPRTAMGAKANRFYLRTNPINGAAYMTLADDKTFTDLQYVRLSDYEALEAKLREARGLVEEWRNDHRDYPESKQDCADELAAILGNNDA